MSRSGRWMQVFCVAVLILILSACGRSNDQKNAEKGNRTEEKQEQVVLDVWHQWEGQGTKLEEFTNNAIDAYEKEHPDTKIVVHSLTSETYKVEIPMKFAGKAEGMDVFYYHVPGYMKRLLDADGLLPLNGYLTEDILGRLHEGTLDETSVDGQIYGLPLYSSKYLVYCNRALFEQVGG